MEENGHGLIWDTTQRICQEEPPTKSARNLCQDMQYLDKAWTRHLPYKIQKNYWRVPSS